MNRSEKLRRTIGSARTALTAPVARLDEVAALEEVTIEAWQDAGADLGVQMAELRKQMTKANRLLGLKSGQQCLLTYFRRREGEVISGAELSGVAGIAEWPRRVRELRQDHGWPIESGLQQPGLRPDQYILVHEVPDKSLVSRWRLASEYNKQKGPVHTRLLNFLRDIAPEVAYSDELARVAGRSKVELHIEKLRAENWKILSAEDDPKMPKGAYRLVP